MSTPTITIVGRLTRDPELRTTKNGRNVCSFTIAANNRRKNQQTGQWEDGTALFLNCTAWDSEYSQMATNVANTLHKGMQVIAQGQISQGRYTDRQGVERTTVELRVDSIGPDLNRYGVDVHEPMRPTASGFTGSQQPQQQAAAQQQAQQQPRDPWSDGNAGADAEWEEPSF